MDAEVKALLLVLLGGEAGLRYGELMALDWSDVDVAHGADGRAFMADGRLIASKWRGVGGGDYATSRSARGFLAAMSNSVRAAPEGARRPCSHSCSVRTDTPNSLAKRGCDSPVPSRMDPW